MSKTRTNIDFLKNSARFPKQEVTPISSPKVQVAKEEWNKAVKVLEQVAVNEEMGKTMLKSFNSEILGQYPLIELALYDDAAEAEMTGTEITIKKVDDSADWRSYGVALPYGLTSGKTYTVVAGDCLWTICQRVYGTGTKWGELWAANASIIENPRLIFPGQVLQIP